MKKLQQHSDKYGKIVEVGEVVEPRETPGVSFSPSTQEAATVAEVVIEDAPKVKAEEPQKDGKKSKKPDGNK